MKPPKPGKYKKEEDRFLNDPRVTQRWSSNVLSLRDKRVLEAIEKWPGVIASELAQYLNLHVTNVGATIRQLLDRHFIERKPVKIMDEMGSAHRGFALYAKTKRKKK